MGRVSTETKDIVYKMCNRGKEVLADLILTNKTILHFPSHVFHITTIWPKLGCSEPKYLAHLKSLYNCKSPPKGVH